MDKKIQGYESKLLLPNQLALFKKIILIHLILSDIKLSISAINVLTYYCVFGFNSETENFILQEEIVSNIQILYNLKNELKKAGLIKSEKRDLRVCKELNFRIKDLMSYMIIKFKAQEEVVINFKDKSEEDV